MHVVLQLIYVPNYLRFTLGLVCVIFWTSLVIYIALFPCSLLCVLKSKVRWRGGGEGVCFHTWFQSWMSCEFWLTSLGLSKWKQLVSDCPVMRICPCGLTNMHSPVFSLPRKLIHSSCDGIRFNFVAAQGERGRQGCTGHVPKNFGFCVNMVYIYMYVTSCGLWSG